MKLDDFKTLAVVSIDDGAKLGYVDDLLFDTKELRVAALRVKQDGVHALVPLADVRSIGSDAVTVQSRAVARSVAAENQLASLPDLEQLKKLKVVDEAGTYLGTVREVEIVRAKAAVHAPLQSPNTLPVSGRDRLTCSRTAAGESGLGFARLPLHERQRGRQHQLRVAPELQVAQLGEREQLGVGELGGQ